MTEWLVPLETLARRKGGDDPRAVGGKAARLVWLIQHGIRVPRAWVLPADAFSAAVSELSPGTEPRSLLRAASTRAGHARAADARQELLSAPLPKGLAEELAELWSKEHGALPWGFAVRSSATCEDGAIVSMAGLAESRVGVRGEAALVDAVRGVWASIASGRALEYLAAHGVKDVSMAVVIQRTVVADAGGVMFTRAPEGKSHELGERVINVGFGLGVPVVDGRSTPDVLRIDGKGEVLSRVIAHKPRATVVTDAGLGEVDTEHPDAPALSDAQIKELADIARTLEQLEPLAWDVEFVCEGASLWVVQARPITGRGFPGGGDANTVWSNANVGESLPGVATPLTWSVAGTFSETGFRRAFSALGCHVPKNARLVGNVFGRFYLNLTQFMKIAAQVPWLHPRTLLELGGGAGGDDLAMQVAHVSHGGFYARFPMTASRLVREQLRLEAEVNQFEKVAEEWRDALSQLDLAILPDEGLARTIRDIQGLLEQTGAVMLTCASGALGTHLLLSASLARVAPHGADRLAHELTRGIRDLESARPGMAILSIAQLARRDPELHRAWVERGFDRVEDLPPGDTRRALQTFLEIHGDRAQREAELSTPRWREDPRPVLTMIRVALRGDPIEMGPSLSRAQARAESELHRIEPRLSLPEQWLVRHLVGRSQRAARLRERMRAWVTRVLGMMRSAFLEADRRLRRLMPELDEVATTHAGGSHSETVASFKVPPVFFLTVDEVVTALRTSGTDMTPMVRARRAEFLRDQQRPDPPTTFQGMPPPVVMPPSGGDLWTGLAASSGVVEGVARVLFSADEMGALVPGEILVVHTTDIGWTPLFLVAAAVVTELGGPLSHAAIVAREFGLPGVVNVAGITRAVKTGDRLRVDGDRGMVERLA